MKQSKITLFTFGYEGWGNHTKELVSNMDRSERMAGRAPPLFVDIRFRRAVRAKGFVSNRFGNLVGAGRYEHMKSLGNARIGSGKGGIKIHEPKAAAKLLDTALEAADDNRRVIYFCSCGYPIGCHRRTVANLLSKEGKKRGIAVTNIEWPGNDPENIELELPREMFAKAAQDRVYVPLPRSAAEVRALPWYSVVSFRLKEDKSRPPIVIFTGPARFVKGAWCLPVLENVEEGTAKRECLEIARQLREDKGYSSF